MKPMNSPSVAPWAFFKSWRSSFNGNPPTTFAFFSSFRRSRLKSVITSPDHSLMLIRSTPIWTSFACWSMDSQALAISGPLSQGTWASCFFVSHVRSNRGILRFVSSLSPLPLYRHKLNATGHEPFTSKNSFPLTRAPVTLSNAPSICALISSNIGRLVSHPDLVNKSNRESSGRPLLRAASQISFICARKQQYRSLLASRPTCCTIDS